MDSSSPILRPCRAQACTHPAAPEQFYCDRHLRLGLQHMGRRLRAVLGSACGAHVGRSSHLERRLLELQVTFGLTRLTVLHWARDWEEADLFEDLATELARRGGRGCPLFNTPEELAGRRCGADAAVYISWSPRSRKGRWDYEAIPVGLLDRGRRLLADRRFPCEVVHFRSDLTAEEAQTELERFRSGNRPPRP